MEIPTRVRRRIYIETALEYMHVQLFIGVVGGGGGGSHYQDAVLSV